MDNISDEEHKNQRLNKFRQQKNMLNDQMVSIKVNKEAKKVEKIMIDA